MNQAPVEPKPKRDVRLHEGSNSKRIIEYLFKHGKSTGERIMRELNLPNSPQSYIQPHINTERVICKSVHQHRATYEISQQMTRKDFGLT